MTTNLERHVKLFIYIQESIIQHNMENWNTTLFKEYIWVAKPHEHRKKMQSNAIETLVISLKQFTFSDPQYPS